MEQPGLGSNRMSCVYRGSVCGQRQAGGSGPGGAVPTSGSKAGQMSFPPQFGVL